MRRVGEELPRVEVRSREELRAWLSEHHASSGSIWLVSYKRVAGELYLPYDAIIEEALCFGWIDSMSRETDAERSMHLLAPRKPGSGW